MSKVLIARPYQQVHVWPPHQKVATVYCARLSAWSPRPGRLLTIRLAGNARASTCGQEEIYTAPKRGHGRAARGAMQHHVERFKHRIRVGFSARDAQK